MNSKSFSVFVKNKFNPDKTVNQVFLLKFEFKLRDFFHEEILTREMASIETLVENLKHEDLKKSPDKRKVFLQDVISSSFF
jgi:hypothetical protein